MYTQAHGGKWLRVQDAMIFHRLEENDSKELIARVLLKANQSVTPLPEHVLNAIAYYATPSTEITPALVRKVLKETPTCYKSLSHMEKLSLLRFVLKDDIFPELLGLALLPLSDGTFTTFKTSEEAIYITTPEHPRELFPGLQERFLDQDVDESTLRKLETVAKKGKHFSFSQFIRLKSVAV